MLDGNYCKSFFYMGLMVKMGKLGRYRTKPDISGHPHNKCRIQNAKNGGTGRAGKNRPI